MVVGNREMREESLGIRGGKMDVGKGGETEMGSAAPRLLVQPHTFSWSRGKFDFGTPGSPH